MVAVAWLWAGIASSALAQEGARPVVELEAHAAGDSFSTFETRLVVGGNGARGGVERMAPGSRAGRHLGRSACHELPIPGGRSRDLRSFGGVEPYVGTRVGGLTTRLDVAGANDTASDWLVSLVAGVRWRKDIETSRGVRVAATDFIVWQEIPLTVPVGGSSGQRRDTRVTNNPAVSARVFLRVGGGRVDQDE